MTFRFQSLPLHALLLALFLALAAAQPPPPSLPPHSSNSTVTLIILLISTALLFLISFAIYIIRFSGVPVNPSDRSLHGATVPKGLDAAVVGGFPTFVYSEVKEHKVGKGVLECAICISEFKDYEMLRLIPRCDHVFHLECIDEWLSGHVTCPVCRADLVPPSGGSVKGRDADSLQEARDHVEIEIGEPNMPMDESTRGRGKEGGAVVVPSRAGKKWRRLGRSHSTGHLVIRPGDDIERFTLRLPDEVRKQILERPMTPCFQGEEGSRRGYRPGEGSSRGRFLKRLDCLDLQVKTERWALRKMPSFLTRVSPIVSPGLPMFANNDTAPDGSSRVPKSLDGEPATERDRSST